MIVARLLLTSAHRHGVVLGSQDSRVAPICLTIDADLKHNAMDQVEAGALPAWLPGRYPYAAAEDLYTFVFRYCSHPSTLLAGNTQAASDCIPHWRSLTPDALGVGDLDLHLV